MVKVIAHRGASQEAPENTLSALTRAINVGSDVIEIDVRLTQEGVPIVIHDHLLGRTTNGAFMDPTTKLPLSQVKALDAGSWFSERFKGEKIPTLDEVLELIQGTLPLLIEVKKENSSPKQLIDAVIASLSKGKGEFIIGSFDPFILQEIWKRGASYPLMAIIEEVSMLEEFDALPIKYAAVWYPLLDAKLIRKLHQKGVEIWTFTVDYPELAKFLASMGIDGIISNHPKLIKEVFNSLNLSSSHGEN